MLENMSDLVEYALPVHVSQSDIVVLKLSKICLEVDGHRRHYEMIGTLFAW